MSQVDRKPAGPAMAACGLCGMPTEIEAKQAKGTAYHGSCWLEVLRGRWQAARSDATRAAILSTAESVKEERAEYSRRLEVSPD